MANYVEPSAEVFLHFTALIFGNPHVHNCVAFLGWQSTLKSKKDLKKPTAKGYVNVLKWGKATYNN